MNKDTKIIWKNIDDLKPYEHNAKEHDETQVNNLALSFKKYGWQNVVLIDENDVIVYGHGRCLGAKKAGLTEAPTILCTDLTEQERREYRILDNKLTESAWLEDELEFELPELDFSDFDLEFEVDEDYNQELLEYMNNDTFADLNDNRSTFEITFEFDNEYKDKVKQYISENTKTPLVEIILKEILNA